MFRFISLLIFSLIVAQPVFASNVTHVFSAQTATAASTKQHFSTSYANVNQVLECSGAVSASTGTATVKLQGSNDGTNWIDLATCSLTLGTSVTASSATNTANWYWYRVNVSALTGTGASVDAWVSY